MVLFSKIKRCDDDRVIKAGLDVLTDFRNVGIGVMSFACCFKRGTLIFSFGYDAPYSENIQTAMATRFANNLPKEEKYKKVEYYPSEKFNAECSKYCKKESGLWLVVDSDN